MSGTDPLTGQPLPADAIQRILFITHPVHIYTIPPRPSTKGHLAAPWTSDPARHIFTARARLVETSIPSDDDESSSLQVHILLEDPSTGALFAACPYTKPAVIEPVLDSSRFFAIQVQDPREGKKAWLGMGFEDRGASFDFAVALQEARRALGFAETEGSSSSTSSSLSLGGATDGSTTEMRDLKLKEGETITVPLPSRFGRRQNKAQGSDAKPDPSPRDLSSFSLAPPPGFTAPSSKRSSMGAAPKSVKDLGFDDGKFGEFS